MTLFSAVIIQFDEITAAQTTRQTNQALST